MRMKLFDSRGGTLLAEENLGVAIGPGGQVELRALDGVQPPPGAVWCEIWDGTERVLHGPCQPANEDLSHQQACDVLARIGSKLNIAD